MNNLKIPFASLDAEMHALQRRSVYYEAKVAALKIGRVTELRLREIRYLESLNRGCHRVPSLFVSAADNPRYD